MVDSAQLDAPEAVLSICQRMVDAGFQCWAVGGAVRDRLAGHPAGDWDLTTSAHPREVQRLFRRTVPIGIDHGTVGVIGRDGRMYEMTTFRRDVENFGRRARVVFSDNLAEDLERRDFTINAIAWNPLTHEIADPHDGMADFGAGILRTVGDPAARFAEDRLRVLRALRFAGRFDLQIEAATWSALTGSSGLLDHLSMERIRDELWKVLGDAAPSAALSLYATSGILATLYPELTPVARHGAIWRAVLQGMDGVSRTHPAVRAALLFRLSGGMENDLQYRVNTDTATASAQTAYAIMRRLRASNADSDRVTHLIARHADTPGAEESDGVVRQWLKATGDEFHRDLFRMLIGVARGDGEAAGLAHLFWRSHSLLAEGVPMSVRDLAIGGADLKAMGLRPGPHYSEILEDLLDRVLVNPELNTREGLLDLVKLD